MVFYLKSTQSIAFYVQNSVSNQFVLFSRVNKLHRQLNLRNFGASVVLCTKCRIHLSISTAVKNSLSSRSSSCHKAEKNHRKRLVIVYKSFFAAAAVSIRALGILPSSL